MRTRTQEIAVRKWIRVSMIVEELDIEADRVLQAIKTGELPALNVSGGDVRANYRIDPVDYEAWKQSLRVRPQGVA